MMTRRTFLLYVCLTALLATGSLGEGLAAGAAVRVITPDPLLPVSGGLGPTKPVTQKRGELSARALVVRKGEVTVAVVVLDVLGFPSVLGDRVRGKVKGVGPENVLIAATHTHSAPCCYAFPDGRGGHTGDLTWMQLVCDRAAEAVNEAVGRLEPVSLRVASGVAVGKIAYNYYAPDLYDRRMGVIQLLAASPGGGGGEGGAGPKVVATLVNYAIHPEVLGNSVGILSPDLVGPLCERVEKSAGGVALFVNGAQGGMITADNRRLDLPPADAARGYWRDERTWEECVRIGGVMADEALRMVKDAPMQGEAGLACWSSEVRFPVESAALWDVVTRSPLKYPHDAERRTVTTRINLVEIGDARILTIPGEAMPNIGFYLKRKMGGKHNLLFGLTNDAFGYILTEVDFGSFPRYAYVSRTSLGERTGTILIEEGLKLVGRAGAGR